jgi:hypothetical protein
MENITKQEINAAFLNKYLYFLLFCEFIKHWILKKMLIFIKIDEI